MCVFLSVKQVELSNFAGRYLQQLIFNKFLLLSDEQESDYMI